MTISFVCSYLPVIVFMRICACCLAQQPIVHVPGLGGIQGSTMFSSSGKTFYAFRGIPYAEPPVGDMRFQEPVPVKPWGKQILDGTREGPSCLQYNYFTATTKGQEDCLILNVYTPNLNKISVKDNLPVMVWIHGGGWVEGSGNFETDFYGPGYILNKNVVLVTLNYRLGPLGFLSTEDAEAPGNYGLFDQSLALKWVYDYIHYFGGKMNQVTIFGESAGGASVEFQVLSPYSTGLFQRAIAQSGSVRCPWALQTTVKEYTHMLAKHLSCPISPSTLLLECLRKKPGKDIVEFKQTIAMPFAYGLYPVGFGPRIDVERNIPFLSDHPDKLVTRKQFNAVPFITGVTENEGGLYSASLLTTDGKILKEFQKDPIKSVLYSIGMEKQKDGYEIARKVYQHYFGDNTKNEEFHVPYGLLSSDFGFFKCVDETAKLYSKYNRYPTYYYNYGHRGQLSFTSLVEIPEELDFGVCHGDELFMLFTSSLMPAITESNDLKVSNLLVDLWTSFAKDGVPKSEHVTDGWLPMEDSGIRYLNIEAKRPKLINSSMPFENRLAFWNLLVGSPLIVSDKDEL